MLIQEVLKKAEELVELYNLENLISTTTITPFDHIKTIFAFDNPKLKIKNVAWKALDPQNINLSENELSIIINYQYEGSRHTTIDGIQIVNGYSNQLKSIFTKYKFKYERNAKDIVEIAKKTIVPATITIKGKIERKKDAR